MNLHWVSRWLDLPSFFASVPEQLPVVWSLHDMNPLTGGCHHAGGCDRFTLHCAECPQLRRPGSRDDAYRFFEIKDRCYRGKNLHIVGNSEWTTAQARRSGLMRHARSFHTILPGLDVEMFKPVDKWCARRALGIEAGRFVVGFACADCADPNKGGAILAEALGALSANAGVTLLAFGGGRLPDAGGRYQRMALGRIDSPTLQTLFYSACDIFAAPSRIESFGLTALEAMACGTPVVAFRTGGLGEVVEAGRTGLLEDSVGDSAGFSRHLIWMLEHPHERQQMGYAARQRVEDRFSSALMAERYSALYRSLLPTGA